MDTPSFTPDTPTWLDTRLTYGEAMAMMDEAVEDAIREATEPRIQIVH